MIGLDTNVLVRYLVWDEPGQAERAASLIETGADEGDSFYVSPVVMCEIAWVLESAYAVGREEVLDTLESLLRTARFTFGDKDVLWRALGDARRGRADYADYVIGRQGEEAGSDVTATFDGELGDSPLFDVL